MRYLPKSLSWASQITLKSQCVILDKACVFQHRISCKMCACVCFYLHYTERGRFHRKGWKGRQWAGRGWRRWRCSASPRRAYSCTGRTCTGRRRRTGALMAERQLSVYLHLLQPHQPHIWRRGSVAQKKATSRGSERIPSSSKLFQ